MGTSWVHLLTKIWRRLGFELVRPWVGRELVSQLGEVPARDGHQLGYWEKDRDHSHDLVPLLGGGYWSERRDGADHRPGPVNGAGAGSRSEPRTLDGPSHAVVIDPWQQEPAGHGHATLGGWTVAISVDCE